MPEAKKPEVKQPTLRMTALTAASMMVRLIGDTRTKVRHCRSDSTRTRRVHAREAWLWQNPAALASVQQGLAEMGRGEAIDLGSFAEYADMELDD